MAEHLQVLDLALDTVLHVSARDLVLVDELERDLVSSDRVGGHCTLVRSLVSRTLDFAKAASTQSPLDHVLADAGLRS